MKNAERAAKWKQLTQALYTKYAHQSTKGIAT